MIGLHLQESPPNWIDALQYLPDYTPVKVIDGVQRVLEIKATNPTLRTWVRHFIEGVDPQGTLSQMKQQARAFFDTFVDESFLQIAYAVDFIQEYNEYFADSMSPSESQRWQQWCLACAQVWNDEYRAQPELAHIKLILAETAVGNNIPVSVAQTAIQYDCILGYHAYVPVWNGEIHPEDWLYYSGRWAQMDAYYQALGVDTSSLYWICGEYGAVGLMSPPVNGEWPNQLDGGSGWLSPTTYGGNVDAFNQMHAYFIDRASQWNRDNNDRFLGAVIFTSGGGIQWEQFELSQPALNQVAQFVGNYAPSPVPPDPVPPDPEPEPPVEDNLLNNPSFENGWTDAQPAPDRLQQPNGWQMTVRLPGQTIWANNSVTGSPSIVTGIPECTHKNCGLLAPDECRGESDALILDGDWSYKMQFVDMVAAVELHQTLIGLSPGEAVKLVVPMQVHYQNDYTIPPRTVPPEPDDIEIHILINGNEARLWQKDIPDREWIACILTTTVPENGMITVAVRFMSKWQNSRDLFLDNLSLEYIDMAPDEYKRVVNLVPQDATESQMSAILLSEEVFNNKQTVCWSADDAGWLVANGTADSFVRVHMADHWTNSIVDYLVDNYGVSVEVVS